MPCLEPCWAVGCSVTTSSGSAGRRPAISSVLLRCNVLLLPAYRLSLRRLPMRVGMHEVLQDRRFVVVCSDVERLFCARRAGNADAAILVKEMAGNAQAVGWMYMLDSVIALSLLYPPAAGAKTLLLPARLMAGLSLMTLALVLNCPLVHHLLALFILMRVFYLGCSIAEPAVKP